jgi:hypothetical protein
MEDLNETISPQSMTSLGLGIPRSRVRRFFLIFLLATHDSRPTFFAHFFHTFHSRIDPALFA